MYLLRTWRGAEQSGEKGHGLSDVGTNNSEPDQEPGQWVSDAMGGDQRCDSVEDEAADQSVAGPYDS